MVCTVTTCSKVEEDQKELQKGLIYELIAKLELERGVWLG